MNGAAWVLFAAWAVTMAGLLVVLLGSAAKQRDMDRAYCRLAAKLLRSEDENARLRRAALAIVRPATGIQSAVAERIRGVIAANEASRWDEQWERFNQDGA